MAEQYAEDYNIYRSSGLNKLVSQIKDSRDLYFLVLMMIQAGIDNKESNTILPEVMLLIDEVSLMNLVWYFGGESITIPTKEEVRDYLQALLLYYYYDVKGVDWKECFEILDVEYNRTESARLIRARNKLIEDLKGIKIPEMKI